MNYENQGKQKKKKTKSYRRNVEKFNKVNKTLTCVPEQKPNAEYYNSEVKVVPLSFSDNIYSRNHVTDQFFAGSIHRGYQGQDWTLKFMKQSGYECKCSLTLKAFYNLSADNGKFRRC